MKIPAYGNGSGANGEQDSGGKIPAFFLHFAVGPVLKLFKQCWFDHRKADAHAALVANPHQPGFGLEMDIAFGQVETDIQQPGEAQGLLQAIESHAASAQIDAQYLDYFSLRILHRDRGFDSGAEKLLLFVADETQRSNRLPRGERDIVFL